jgi:hypothetical protein
MACLLPSCNLAAIDLARADETQRHRLDMMEARLEPGFVTQIRPERGG